jgi:hypothetical protein
MQRQNVVELLSSSSEDEAPAPAPHGGMSVARPSVLAAAGLALKKPAAQGGIPAFFTALGIPALKGAPAGAAGSPAVPRAAQPSSSGSPSVPRAAQPSSAGSPSVPRAAKPKPSSAGSPSSPFPSARVAGPSRAAGDAGDADSEALWGASQGSHMSSTSRSSQGSRPRVERPGPGPLLMKRATSEIDPAAAAAADSRSAVDARAEEGGKSEGEGEGGSEGSDDESASSGATSSSYDGESDRHAWDGKRQRKKRARRPSGSAYGFSGRLPRKKAKPADLRATTYEAEDDATSVLTNPTGEEEVPEKVVDIPRSRLLALSPALRGPLLMHGLASCFDDVMAFLTTTGEGQDAGGAILELFTGVVPSFRRVVTALELPDDDEASKAALVSRAGVFPRPGASSSSSTCSLSSSAKAAAMATAAKAPASSKLGGANRSSTGSPSSHSSVESFGFSGEKRERTDKSAGPLAPAAKPAAKPAAPGASPAPGKVVQVVVDLS